MPYLKYRNTETYYTDKGKGRAVVLLHGFLESSSMWLEFEKELSKRNRIIKIDLLGHGESGCLGYIHRMKDFAGAIKNVLDSLKLKKYIVVGHSMGGYVGLSMAEEHPDNILGLMLFYSTAAADNSEKKENRDRAISLAKQNCKSFIRTSIPLLFRPKSRRMFSNEIKALKSESLKMSTQGVIAALEGMKIREDREALLHFSPYPVAIVSGRMDPVIPLDSMSSQHEAEKVVQLTITENGHMGHIEDRIESLDAIKTFIKQIV